MEQVEEPKKKRKSLKIYIKKTREREGMMNTQNKICALGFFVEKQYSFGKIKYSEMCTLRTHCVDIEKELSGPSKDTEKPKNPKWCNRDTTCIAGFPCVVEGINCTSKSVPHEQSKDTEITCLWTRTFDGHFNISCYSGERANGNFKGEDAGAKWEFKNCPYCGRKIEIQKIDLINKATKGEQHG